MKKKSLKMCVADIVFMICVYVILTTIFVATLYPMIFILSASFSNPGMVSAGKLVLWPVGFNLDGYKYLLDYKEIWAGYSNTFIYTIGGTILNLLATIPAAYALSRWDLKGKGFFMGIFVVTMYFSGGLIPSYLNVKSLGLLNTRTIIMIMGLVSPYNLIVARTFFSTSIPRELHEAAYIDGATDFQTFRQVVLPLSKPILAVMTLYYGVGHWNSYFSEMIYLKDEEKFPLQLVLKRILLQADVLKAAIMEGAEAETIKALMADQDAANQLKYGVIVVSTVPMLILYPFLEKYFAKGVMIGSVKG